LLWTFKYFSLKEFLGISQIIRWYRNEYEIDDVDEKMIIRIEGPYKYSRHPVYFFSMIFLVFRPEMAFIYSSFLVCIIVYFYIGSFYEEKKLVDKFGKLYMDYQSQVPRIVPIYFFKNILFEKKRKLEI